MRELVSLPLAVRESKLEAQDIEIMMSLLTPRAARAESAGDFRAAGAPEATQIMSRVRAARDEFERRRTAGDTVASAILAVGASAWADDGIADLAAAIAGQPVSGSFGEDRIASLIHDCAVEALKARQVNRAAVLLATMQHLGIEEAEALSGLALCGARLGKFDEALTLATECLKLPVKHPRAYCIAGFCELERGNRKAAQSFLALGARIARSRPEFAEDLRAAQRVLLILHFT
jgi:Flp pilus assembly protein TadD